MLRAPPADQHRLHELSDPMRPSLPPPHEGRAMPPVRGCSSRIGGLFYLSAIYRSRIDIPGKDMAGKTGTSQARRITLEKRRRGVIKIDGLPWRQRDHALFVTFAPVRAARYACAVVAEHGGGHSLVAAPIARDILIAGQRRDPSRRNRTLKEADGRRPDREGNSLSGAPAQSAP